MALNDSKVVECICPKQNCWRSGDEKLPSYCAANTYLEEIEAAKREYLKDENIRLYSAACEVGAVNDGFRPRIEEALHFAKQLNCTRVGLAVCAAFENETRILKSLFSQEGIQLLCTNCPIGGVTAEERGLPQFAEYINSACNPIAQAKILNREKTELNFIVGLCMGHDILFTRYSDAPVSTLIVKDRMTGNNPAAALYGHHARRNLFKISRSDSRKV